VIYSARRVEEIIGFIAEPTLSRVLTHFHPPLYQICPDISLISQ
jgi:hypothetical protein